MVMTAHLGPYPVIDVIIVPINLTTWPHPENVSHERTNTKEPFAIQLAFCATQMDVWFGPPVFFCSYLILTRLILRMNWKGTPRVDLVFTDFHLHHY